MPWQEAFCAILLFVSTMTVFAQKWRRPNVILILTDDQDSLMGGMEPMVKTKRLVADRGVTFNNAYVTTPVCCPSRASILTGKYVHNHGVKNNTPEGGCSGSEWIDGPERSTIAVHLQRAGYTTFYAGKYMNGYGNHAHSSWNHVPPGWQWWNGLVGNSVYYNYSLSINGTTLENHGDADEDYLTNIIAEKAKKFLNVVSTNPDRPFFMMLCPPAPHSPFEPYDEYKNAFENISIPKTPIFNVHFFDKHWLVGERTPTNLNPKTLEYIEKVHKNRWRTLLSVDDMVEMVIDQLKLLNVYDETYIIFSSDNGYHLGQFCLPLDKRQLYEFDVKIPMIVVGPNVSIGKLLNPIVLNIDLAPTILEMAKVFESPSVDNEPEMDGRSFCKFLSDVDDEERRRQKTKWRKNFLIEYWGEANHDPSSSECPSLKNLSQCHIQEECICQDALNNTYKCVREINRTTTATNFIFCRFNDDVKFVEAYDVKNDPYQMINLASSNDVRHRMKPSRRRHYERKLFKLSRCRATYCT